MVVPFQRIALVILILFFSTLLGACGGGGSSSSGSAPPVTNPAELEPPETKPPVVACPSIHPHENYLAFGDSLTFGIGDGANVTADGCYEGRGYPTLLIDKLNNAKGRKHVVINGGLSGATSLDGVNAVEAHLAGNESMHVLVMFGTNDSSGADGSNVDSIKFKENMGIIVDRIRAAGKNAYLAKIPPVLGETRTGSRFENIDSGRRNVVIQAYNKKIDDLVREKGINISPPDFYNHFKSRPELYSDNIHLNGAGYLQMAELWKERLKYL